MLLIGTGLTMVDTVLSLLDGGHQGAITALSRRGLTPRAHAIVGGAAGPAAEISGKMTLSGMVATVRAAVARAEAAGLDWRTVIDGLRPRIQTVWGSADFEQKRRFLRHLRPWWDAHRYRVPPEVAERLKQARRSGQVTVKAGRIRHYRTVGERVWVGYVPRGGEVITETEASVVINCSGPACDFARVRDPLTRRLLERGLARPDPLALGLEVTEGQELVGADGRPTLGLHAIGPIARGRLWEITAVPEISAQAQELARRLAMVGAATVVPSRLTEAVVT